MSVAILKCGQCQKEYSVEDEVFADSCGHYKCRECILGASGTSCNQCVMTSAGALVNEKNTVNEKNPLKTKKESKVSNQTHIVEQLSDVGSIQYHCTACGKTFRSRSQKYYHLQCNQPNDALYECDVCQKTFARHSQFKYHSESHTSPINECHKCPKTFSNPLALKKHEALHKVEPKPCPHCDKTFLKKISLEQHVAAQHLHQLQYGCALCNKKYASKSTLQLHLQSHEKKRFECSFCGKHFQRNSILNLHLKRHNHTDTYKCKMCDKLFSESGALARHQKIHEENAIHYHCILCDKDILRKDNMTRHVNTLHPEEKFDDIVLVIRPLTENFNEKKSEKSEEHRPIDDSQKLDVTEQRDFGHSYDKSTGTENVKDYNHLFERNEIKPLNNIVIIENIVLQKPKETQTIEPAVDDATIFITDDLNKVKSITKIARDYNNKNLNAAIYKPVIVKQIQNITTFSNANDDFSQNNGYVTNTLISNPTSYAGKQAETQTECNSSLMLNLEQNISFATTLTKSASENKMLEVLTPNKHPNAVFFKSTNLESHITDTESQKASNEFMSSHYNVSPKGSNFCETSDQAIHNKASVIRTIGNVKKMLTLSPSTTTVSPSIVPNKVLLDCEYKHKKYSRHYNVDLYRKILGCDDDDDDDDDDEDNSEGDQHHCNHQSGKQDNSYDATNATPVHWRKSFKNSYETSTL